MAVGAGGILYVYDEFRHRVLKFTAKGLIKSVPLDLSSVGSFFRTSAVNAPFEGIVVGDGKLYLANVRSHGQLLEFDLESGQFEAESVCRAGTFIWPDPHYLET